VARALQLAVVDAGLDISSVEIDDNSKNAISISSYKRVNGPERRYRVHLFVRKKMSLTPFFVDIYFY
jgi:hypothetical protein